MKFMLDTANLKTIKYYNEILPLAGVTSNPSIIKTEGKIDFFKHFKELRKIIGMDKSLHIQVVATDCQGILKDAEVILGNIDDKVYIKVPVTEEGLKAIKILKSDGVAVTATAIYSKIQGDLAIEAEADYIAPYFNRMENMNINPRDTIKHFAGLINKYNSSTLILAASFRNIGQVTDALECGAHSVTIGSSLLNDALKLPAIQNAVDNFTRDWEGIFGKDTSIIDLI
ncbi:MAG: fructose-6-phosphate aldolase [Firmicutes bacterium]|nr:fructose-6-phosphate aldolase [Bacillota bacterium]